MKYKCVLFDLDGTLTDPAEGIYRCFRIGLKSAGLSEPNDERLRRVIGPPLFDSYTEFYGMSEDMALNAINAYRVEFTRGGMFENYVYEGIPEMLRRLYDSGVYILTATSKREKDAADIIQHFNLSKYIHRVCGASEDLSRSNKEDVIEYALSFVNGIKKCEVLMVGDRKYDLIGAAQIGIDGAGVLYGYGDFEELSSHKSVYIAKTPLEIADFVLNN